VKQLVRSVYHQTDGCKDDDRQSFFFEVNVCQKPNDQCDRNNCSADTEWREIWLGSHVGTSSKYDERKARRSIDKQSRYRRDGDRREERCLNGEKKYNEGIKNDRDIRSAEASVYRCKWFGQILFFG
jgi:hypothetical protein